MNEEINAKLVLGTYWKILKGYRWPFALVWFVIVVASLVGIFFPWIYKMFFDALTNPAISHDEAVIELMRVIVYLTALHLIAWTLWRISGVYSMFIYPKADVKISMHSFDYLVRHSYRFFTNKFAGSLVRRMNRFTYSFTRIGDKIQWDLIPLGVSSIGITVILTYRNIWLGVATGVWILIFVLINIWLSIWKLKYDMRRAAADSKVTGVLSDVITNASNVKLFSSYNFEHDNFFRVIYEQARLWRFTWGLAEIIIAIQVLLMIAIEIVLMYVGVLLWRDGILTVGDFALLQGYLISLFEKLWNFGHTIRDLYEHVADATEMAQVLNEPHEVSDIKSAKPLVIKKGKIEFQNVSFNYHKTRAILENFSLKIKPGEKVALVGPSGAGKSTITKLIFRLFDIGRGKILIDGQQVSRVTLESLWSQVSLVPQEPILFHRTLMENIRYGRRDATDEEVFEAARKARCHDFINELPQGYETFVGERGVKLSGGERQRVAIARAILKGSPILLLDEATSSLDSESEHLIQEALQELMKNRTTIVIAHRLSTIMQMDRIVVMNRGGIIDEGTHDELLQRDGMYKKLWDIQAGGFI
jgi:ATP-binding cassette subfamily B protein